METLRSRFTLPIDYGRNVWGQIIVRLGEGCVVEERP